MKCTACEVEMVHWMATRKAPYAYTRSGLKNVYLSGIAVHECPECRTGLPLIPKVEQLHQVIAHELAAKPTPLTGDELRFLRKNAGFPANKFAALLGVDPAHLSRIENGHRDSLGDPADRLARAIAMIAKDGKAAREILLTLAEKIEKPPAVRNVDTQKPLFNLDKQGKWLRAA